MSETNLYMALSKAQGEFTDIPKSKKGYGYNYAPLEAVVAMIRPVLAKHGLCILQQLMSEEDGLYIYTILAHESKEQVTSKVKVIPMQGKSMNALQAEGASITYLKRYALSALLCLTTDEDTDAADLEAKPSKTTQSTTKATKASSEASKASLQSLCNQMCYQAQQSGLDPKRMNDYLLYGSHKYKLANEEFAKSALDSVELFIKDYGEFLASAK